MAASTAASGHPIDTFVSPLPPIAAARPIIPQAAALNTIPHRTLRGVLSGLPKLGASSIDG